MGRRTVGSGSRALSMGKAATCTPTATRTRGPTNKGGSKASVLRPGPTARGTKANGMLDANTGRGDTRRPTGSATRGLSNTCVLASARPARHSSPCMHMHTSCCREPGYALLAVGSSSRHKRQKIYERLCCVSLQAQGFSTDATAIATNVPAHDGGRRTSQEFIRPPLPVKCGACVWI